MYLASKNTYRLMRAKGVTHEEVMEIIRSSSRDNSRTPMQWSNETNAGFSTGTPWLKMNTNFKDINVAAQQQDETSILRFYKKMIELRKANKVFIYGTFDLILEKDPHIFAYTRTLQDEQAIVLVNLSEKQVAVKKAGCVFHYDQLLLNNYAVPKHGLLSEIILNPYETRVYRVSPK